MSKPSYFVHEKALVETTDIGEGTRVWAFAHVMPNSKLGKGCNIGDHAFVESHVTLGDNVTVKNGVSIWQHVIVGDSVFVGPNAVFTNDRFPRSRSSDWTPEETIVEEGVTIGANATIVCGVKLGARCMIGAGSVVTKDVPAHALVYGAPARQKGWVCFCGNILKPAHNEQAGCPKCPRIYKISGGQVSELSKT